MADGWVESMVGGTIFHREMIQREISRVLVLNLSGQQRSCFGTAQDIFVLDSTFALIEGRPFSIWGQKETAVAKLGRRPTEKPTCQGARSGQPWLKTIKEGSYHAGVYLLMCASQLPKWPWASKYWPARVVPSAEMLSAV
jgi:hypothetical protein